MRVDWAATPAGVGPRAVARAIDAILLAGAAFGAARLAAFAVGWLVATNGIRPGWEQRLSAPGWPTYLALAALPFVHDVVAESIGGASMGKLVMGLRVRDLDLFAIGWGDAARRALAGAIDFAAFGVVGGVLAWRTGQRLGDRWAETLVVRSSSVVGDELGRALGGAFAALVVAQIVAALGLVAGVL